jgi:hypothetical protein
MEDSFSDIDTTKSKGGFSTKTFALVFFIMLFFAFIVTILFVILGNDSDDSDDSDDEIVVPEEIADIVDLRDTSKYTNDAEDLDEYIQEVQEIGWFTLNKAQHQYEIDNIDYDKEDEKILDAADITAISTMFNSMFDYAVSLSYTAYGDKSKKDDKRKNRDLFKEKLIELMNKCSPYGKTYNEFKECVEPYIKELNSLGPYFENKEKKWNKTVSTWSFTSKETAGDINLDYMIRGKIRTIHFIETMPVSNYTDTSPEVTLLGWLAYNDAQHAYMMRKSNVENEDEDEVEDEVEDEDEDEDMLTLEDIKIIANFFLELWRTAQDQSFDRKGHSHKKKKFRRQKRNMYMKQIEELQDTCSPYGKNYIEFGTCIQSYMVELENLGVLTHKKPLYGESLDNETIDKLYN